MTADDVTRPRRYSPPSHLKAAGRRLWAGVVKAYQIDDVHARELLRLACEAVDRADDARQAIDKDGAYQPGRYEGSIRPHPALAVERDSAIRASRLLRELGLLDVPESRPPSRWRS